MLFLVIHRCQAKRFPHTLPCTSFFEETIHVEPGSQPWYSSGMHRSRLGTRIRIFFCTHSEPEFRPNCRLVLKALNTILTQAAAGVPRQNSPKQLVIWIVLHFPIFDYPSAVCEDSARADTRPVFRIQQRREWSDHRQAECGPTHTFVGLGRPSSASDGGAVSAVRPLFSFHRRK